MSLIHINLSWMTLLYEGVCFQLIFSVKNFRLSLTTSKDGLITINIHK